MQKTAVVVGGASGVGNGIAKALIQRGFRLVVADVNAPADLGCDYINLDATQDASVAQFKQTLLTDHQQIDALAITVGAIDEGSIIGASIERWRWMFETNLLASVRVVDALLPNISEGGSLLLTGSGSGLITPAPETGLGMYAVTKHALTGYFRALRGEAATRGVSVSLLVPSGVDGSLADNSALSRVNAFDDSFAPERGRQPAGRMLVDAEVVGDDFVRQWLEGHPLISNDADRLSAAVLDEAQFVVNALR